MPIIGNVRQQLLTKLVKIEGNGLQNQRVEINLLLLKLICNVENYSPEKVKARVFLYTLLNKPLISMKFSSPRDGFLWLRHVYILGKEYQLEE